MARSEFERKLIHDAMEQMKKCAERKDTATVLVLLRLCKHIEGDEFKVSIQKDGKEFAIKDIVHEEENNG